MRECIQGLGWFVRRGANASALGQFYSAALGLPVLRQWENPDSVGTMFYAGDVSVFEINRGGQTAASDPAQAECTPIFRVRNLDAALGLALRAGAQRLTDDAAGGVDGVFVCDAFGHVFGLRNANDAAPSSADVLAKQQWEKGTHILEGLPVLPAPFQNLGAVRLRVEDPKAMAAFYHEMLGVDVLSATSSGATLYLGGTNILELIPGGTRRTPPKDRIDVTDVWILRIYDYVAMKAHLAANRVHRVNALELAGGWLDYYADPEGHLFGFQERKAPDPLIANSNLIEDGAARRRWLAA